MKQDIKTRAGEPEKDEGVLWLTWLVRLRWVALLAQTVTLAFTFSVLHTPWLVLPLAGVMTLLAALNVEAMRALATGREITQLRLVIHLTVEIVALTVFLALSGGVGNPFVVLYLVHVCMGAVMLTWGKATVVTLVVLACYGVLWLAAYPLHLERHSMPQPMLFAIGQALAFIITAVSAAGFTVGVSRTLRGHKAALLQARDRTARVDRLRTVGTLAAGAAHELNTPLFTMGLRLRRIRRRFDAEPDTQRDVQAIQDQLDRCKEIVESLLVGAGDPSASGLEQRELGELVQSVAHMWSRGASVEVEVDDLSEALRVEVPPVPFRQALINLLENAREAQNENGETAAIEVRITREGDDGVVRVRDHGIGLPDQAEESIGDPFFTTKPTGTGLGVYVARAVADGAGGGLRYTQDKGRWTEAIWWFPSVQDEARAGRT